MHPVETAAGRGLRWLAVGLLSSLPLLAVKGPASAVFVIHLAVLVAFGLGLGRRLAPLADDDWFPSLASERLRRLAAAAGVVVTVTGVVGLVTLASSAALRLHPSTQFLQLLSALDIAWATAALMIGVRWMRGGRTATAAGVALGTVCVWSIWRYLANVGFGPAGEWIVTRAGLMQYVLPYDTAAGVCAVAAVLGGIRRRQATVQPSAQS